MERYDLIKFFVLLVFAVAVTLGLYWLMWIIWTWTLPQLWQDGPEQFINPGYWLFSATLFLLGVIGRAVIGKS